MQALLYHWFSTWDARPSRNTAEPIIFRSVTPQNREFAAAASSSGCRGGKLVSPEQRRGAVEYAPQQYGLSERNACRLVRQWSGTQRHTLQRNDEDALSRAILALATKYGLPFHCRSGSHRAIVLQRRDSSSDKFAGRAVTRTPAGLKAADLLSCRQLLVTFRDGEFRPEQSEHDPVFFLVHESKDMGAAFTEPEMLHSVEAS